MIRYILVDDEPKILERVKAKIDSIAKDYELKHIASYSSSKKAFEEVQEDTYDLLIVDYQMPVYKGIELAQKIATNKKIIFLTSTTNNEKKVINSLDISGYLSKPFDIEEFEEILKHKVIGKLQTNIAYNQGDLVTIATGVTQDIGFYPNKIYYITSSKTKNGEKASKNCVHFFGAQDEVIAPNVRLTVAQLSIKLKPYGFEKINQSTLINLNMFDKRFNKELHLKHCEETFNIGESEKEAIISKLRS
ncbi:LytR/AlgR family response regulator transcription factor [Winogradskyella schleiferi]|uniref:LytR/AlgR family response regulator transcription factor n=1 Tax=Winogradskyella schleiferi TaxID=2686078 RepID=UPI0015B85E63|nr:response regulator [Winogradskyella schleiferi]